MARKRQYYKILLANGRAPASKAPWSLPYKARNAYSYKPGMWHTVTTRLEMCHTGLHLVSTPEQIRHWLRLEWGATTRRLFLAETRGRAIRHGKQGPLGKYLVRTARLVREIKKGTKEWDLVVYGDRS